MAFYRSRGYSRRRFGGTRYPSRRATAALATGTYARYRALRGSRKNGYRGSYRMRRVTVAGNTKPMRYAKAKTDFPLYLPRSVTLRQEQKFFDSIVTATPPFMDQPINADGSSFFLGYPSRGDSLSSRLGDRILLNSLLIRGTLKVPQFTPASQSPFTFVDMFLVWDYAPRETATLPAPNVVFSIAVSTDGNRFIGLLQNPVNRDRFALLYRYRYKLTGSYPTAPAGTPTSFIVGSDNSALLIDLNLAINKTVSFSTTNSTGDLDAVTRGGLYLYLFSNQGFTAQPAEQKPFLSANCRLLFADL